MVVLLYFFINIILCSYKYNSLLIVLFINIILCSYKYIGLIVFVYTYCTTFI